MIKILYVLSYISPNGGVQSVAMNYFNELKKHSDVKIDFLCLLPGDEELEKKIQATHSNVYHIAGSKEKNLGLYIREIKRFFKEHHDYDILHSHQTNLDFFYLKEAKKYKIPVRIMHSHNTNCNIGKMRMYITKKLSKYFSNEYFGCSNEAGCYYFGNVFNKKGTVLNNAINLEKFSFNEELREKAREELNVSNNFLIGNIARMDDSKNQQFLLKIFSIIKKRKANAKLLLVGDGPNMNKLKEMAAELKISEDVIFYGIARDTARIYQALDCFVLTSKFEGVPLTCIEAIASGLTLFAENNIDTHLVKNNYEHKIEKLYDEKLWAETILKYSMPVDRTEGALVVKNSGFSIINEGNVLYNIYKEYVKNI